MTKNQTTTNALNDHKAFIALKAMIAKHHTLNEMQEQMVEMAFRHGFDAANQDADAKHLEVIRTRASRFTTPAIAITAQVNTTKPTRCMLGDDQMVWLVTPADAAWLEARGFEYAC